MHNATKGSETNINPTEAVNSIKAQPSYIL